MLLFSILSFGIGVFLMIGSDAQKFYILENKKGLITTGFFAKTRNPNYLGEILIYASFGLVCNSTPIWIYLGVVWVAFFGSRMLVKDASLSKKKEFKEYEKNSYLILPKLFGKDLHNAVFYGSVLVSCISHWLI